MFIKLTKIVSDRERQITQYNDTEEPGEGGDREVVTTPVVVNAAAIRCYYPRRDNRVGTRITFTDGGGFAVTETKEAVDALVAV